MGIARKTLLATIVLTLLATPVLAQSDAVDVSAHASFEAVSPGGFQDADCLIENVGTEPVMVLIRASVTYADGDVQEFRRLSDGPVPIDANGAFFLSIGFAVPQDAALGTATFTCEVRVLGAAGMGSTESATATFQVA